jgi:Mitochondrial biogenesis AIM24
MQRLTGDGLCFVHAGGTVHPVELGAGDTLRVDTGCLVALQPSVGYDIEYVGKIKTALFGGEGLFFATLTGPGQVWLQSLPFSRMADRIYKAAPSAGGTGARVARFWAASATCSTAIHNDEAGPLRGTRPTNTFPCAQPLFW